MGVPGRRSKSRGESAGMGRVEGCGGGGGGVQEGRGVVLSVITCTRYFPSPNLRNRLLTAVSVMWVIFSPVLL